MSSLSAIAARVKLKMETITDIGVVHDRMRLADHENDWPSLVTTTIGGQVKLRAWYIHLARMPTPPADAGGRMEWHRQILVEGFLQFEDSTGSELTAATFAEDIIRTLYADIRTTKLGGTVLSGLPGEIQDAQPRQFAGAVCSYVRLAVPVTTIDS